MTFRHLIAAASFAVSVAAVPTVASATGHGVLVNIDAQSATGTTVALNPGTYALSWVGIAGGGLYDAWQYNTANSGNFRDSFTVSFGGLVRTYDRNDGNANYTNYTSAAAALADFQHASGAQQFIEYNGASVQLLNGPLTFTVSAPVSLTFSVPDYYFHDNKGGVSLAITTAVPEPESYALMLAGIAGVGVVARRRRQPLQA